MSQIFPSYEVAACALPAIPCAEVRHEDASDLCIECGMRPGVVHADDGRGPLCTFCVATTDSPPPDTDRAPAWWADEDAAEEDEDEDEDDGP